MFQMKAAIPVGVIVPLGLWRVIESEKETAYLLNSENMKRRLIEFCSTLLPNKPLEMMPR